jgi:hypothetical protein
VRGGVKGLDFCLGTGYAKAGSQLMGGKNQLSKYLYKRNATSVAELFVVNVALLRRGQGRAGFLY